MALAFGVLTPPRGGPYCTANCLDYPWDARAFVPGDYLWMVAALIMLGCFLMLVIVLREAIPADHRLPATVGVVLATLATGLLAADYAIQLAVVAPSLLDGQAHDVVLVSMYNPHGVFIALEDAGYLLVALSLLAVAFAIPAGGRLATSIKLVFSVAGGATVVALAAYVAVLGAELEYQFEVAAIGITWLALIIGGALLGAWFRREPAESR